ncbi:MAG: hypothetical protein KGY75_08260 [Candidatus Cloacimonetes bacterium]|nr:hypothetical protein [Candidatus Cloacimonadota bacterium]MBS3768095.1 hypothetical protein [Candidatus Cloacimonadota bacterium]
MKANENFKKEIVNNKWRNVYWFLRMLINHDKYGAIGKDNDLLTKIYTSIKTSDELTADIDNEDKILKIKKSLLKKIFDNRFRKNTAIKSRVNNFLNELDNKIKTLRDMDIFLLTCEFIMKPLNIAIDNIPSNDKDFTLEISRSLLEEEGEKALADIVQKWDELGTKGCLTAERIEIIKVYTMLKLLISEEYEFDNIDESILLTAVVQEFERRAGQKRKGRAGSSLEDVTSFILKFFNIPSASKPEHFETDIEIDNWIKTKDNWLIGISCKRTLRERWKQVSSADKDTLSKHKIKYLYNIVTYDEDLSDKKLTSLGSKRHIFYLPDKSRTYQHATKHTGLRDYVRPISCLIKDLKKEI